MTKIIKSIKLQCTFLQIIVVTLLFIHIKLNVYIHSKHELNYQNIRRFLRNIDTNNKRDEVI